MIDDEIIKALECCSDYFDCDNCECKEYCPKKADVIETSNIKAEAVRVFEERAIKKICEKVYAPTPVQSCIVERCNQVIVETAKEMAGDTYV